MKSMFAGVGLCMIASLALDVAHAAMVRNVDLPAIEHNAATLEVTGPSGSRTYSPAELESLGAARIVTVTPWREEPATFEGVPLRTLIAAHGLSDATALRVIAENDYEVVVPREVWESVDILVATRVDGAAHTRRARGPIQFVMPMDQYEASATVGERYWVWMAAKILPAD